MSSDILNDIIFEDASREGEQECWSEGGCLELSEMESGSWRDLQG